MELTVFGILCTCAALEVALYLVWRAKGYGPQ